MAIGFIAGVPEDRIEKVGNASLEGATIMLMSGHLRQKIEELVKTVEHIELETEPDFFDFFVEGLPFQTPRITCLNDYLRTHWPDEAARKISSYPVLPWTRKYS